MFKFLISNLLKNNLNKKQLLFIYTLNLSIIIVNLLILYYINILLIQKDIVEKLYNIECKCLIPITTLKILNNISLLISLFLIINLIMYIIALIYNDIGTLNYYNQILNKDLEIKEPKKPEKDDYKIVKINLPKEPKKKCNNRNNIGDDDSDGVDTSISSLDVNNSSINTINTDDFSRNNYDISADSQETDLYISADSQETDLVMNNIRRIRINPNISGDSQVTEPDMYDPQTGRIISNPERDWINMGNRLG
tara:strand:- start:4765 stop:5520 length:756 start_codon:yes stop_codon:yes gene_type:complete